MTPPQANLGYDMDMIASDHPLYINITTYDVADIAWTLPRALEALKEIHTALDERIVKTTGNERLPCYEPRDGCKTCSRCCHESVFLTPLEWLGVVAYMQEHFTAEQLTLAINQATGLYRSNKETIDAFLLPPKKGEKDHFYLAKDLHFTCPLLGPDGCTIYPAREILGRVFGQSFNPQGGIYGCELSGAHFGAREVTLVKAQAWAKLIEALPMTGYRQVYPWYFARTYNLALRDEQG